MEKKRQTRAHFGTMTNTKKLKKYYSCSKLTIREQARGRDLGNHSKSLSFFSCFTQIIFASSLISFGYLKKCDLIGDFEQIMPGFDYQYKSNKK